MDDLKNKGIIPIIGGGLGNQLFQVCAAYCASIYNKCPLYILDIKVSKNTHNIFNNNYNKNIFKYFKNNVDILETDELIHELIKMGYTYHRSYGMEYSAPYNISEIQPGTLIKHYYQYYPAIEPYENEIRTILLKGLEDIRNNIKCANNICENSIFIHIRRGDYVNSQGHYLQPIEYYENAYMMLKSLVNIQQVYIVSDDIEYVMNQEFFNSLENKTFWKNPDEIETLALMSLCTGGAICANSSFSWWGAFMGAYSIKSPIIMPKKYFINEPISLFPKEWIII